jgi:hypothetical protein
MESKNLSPESIEKNYKQILLLVARIIYTKLICGPVAPYIQGLLLFIILIPADVLIKLNNKIILLMYKNFIVYVKNKLNLIKGKKNLIQTINDYYKTKLNSILNLV